MTFFKGCLINKLTANLHLNESEVCLQLRHAFQVKPTQNIK